MKRKRGKIVIAIVAAMMVFSIGVSGVLAAGYGHGRNFADRNACYYIDANDDEICDNHDKECHSRNGCGKNFTDADDDGICDNYGTRHGGYGRCGYGRHKK